MTPVIHDNLVRKRWRGVEWYNLTSHVIRIYADDKATVVVEFPPSGLEVRVPEIIVECETVGGIPCVHKEYGPPESIPNMPPVTADGRPVRYIVSTPVLEAGVRAGRVDLVTPDNGPDSVVKDVNGELMGVKRWKR